MALCKINNGKKNKKKIRYKESSIFFFLIFFEDWQTSTYKFSSPVSNLTSSHHLISTFFKAISYCVSCLHGKATYLGFTCIYKRYRKLQLFLSILDKLINNSKMYSPFYIAAKSQIGSCVCLLLSYFKVGNSMLSEMFLKKKPYRVGFLFYSPIISKVQYVNIYLAWTVNVGLFYFPHWSHVLHLPSLFKLLWPRHMENVSRYVTASKEMSINPLMIRGSQVQL